MLPRKSWLLPEYQASISRPFTEVFFSSRRSIATSLPSRMRNGTPSRTAAAITVTRSGAFSASAPMPSSR